MDEPKFFDSAFERWTYEGLECAMCVAPLGNAVSGYVKLPEGHPDADVDYDVLDGEYEVHGGLTFAQDGWVGFDTAHAFDIWEPEELLPLLNTDYERRGYERMQEMARSMPTHASIPELRWTVSLVRAETERLASQVLGRQGVAQ